MNDIKPSPPQDPAANGPEPAARPPKLVWAKRLWTLAFVLFIAAITTIDFPPCVVWKLPVFVRAGLLAAMLAASLAAVLLSKSRQ